jgi:hypothetical protein
MSKVKIVRGQLQRGRAAKRAHANRRVIIATGPIPSPHEILDAVFAIDSHTEGFWAQADPAKACAGEDELLMGDGVGAH